MTATPMGRFALLGLIFISLCAPVHARSRFEAISNEDLLRRSLAALASPDTTDAGIRAKAQALNDLAELRNPPANAKALAVDALRGPSGYKLAPYVGRLLLRLDADGWQAIASLTMSGQIPESRGEIALKPFVEANEARVDWEKRPGLPRSKAFSTLLQLRAVTHEEFAQAIADKDTTLRSAAPLVAAFLNLTNEDWQTIAALLRDPDPKVRQSAIRALMEDSAPNPSQFDSPVFALRYDAAVGSHVQSWFAHGDLSQDQIDQLLHDLRTRPEPDQRLALNLLNALVPTHPDKLLPTLAAFASEASNPPTATQGALSILQATIDRLGRDALGKPDLEQQLLARLTPLLRNSAIAEPVHMALLATVAKLQIDTNDLADLFIRDFALTPGSSHPIVQQCLDHANKVNPARFAQAIWLAQHNPDPQIVKTARTYAADQQLSGVWMLALKQGSIAEQHEALEAFEEHGIAPDLWPALADCMQSPDAALRGKALRALVHMAALQNHIDAAGRALLRDVILAALNDPDARVQRAALAQAGSDYVFARPEARNAVLAHLHDGNDDMQATAWNALATGLPTGVFGNLRQACPEIDDILNEALWHGKPDVQNAAIRIWEVEHRGAPLPWQPGQILLLATLTTLCAVFLGLLQHADWRGRGVQFEDLTPTDDEEEAEYATRAVGSFIIAATLAVALPMLWAAAARLMTVRYGLICALSLPAYLLAGAALTRWGKLIRTGRLLDRLVALALVSLAMLPSLFLCAALIAGALTRPGHLPAWMLLSQVAAVVAVLALGACTIWRIILTFRTPTVPPIPESLTDLESQQAIPWQA